MKKNGKAVIINYNCLRNLLTCIISPQKYLIKSIKKEKEKKKNM